jgi:translation initiation factor 2B subunit (eIF-2B alpha/beta/delta family)
MEKFDLLLAKLIDDETSGAEQLVPVALDVIEAILEHDSEEEIARMIDITAETIQERLPEMIALRRIARSIEKLPRENLHEELAILVSELRERRIRETASVAQLASSLIRENSTVATISQSSTVLNAFFRAKDSGLDFHVIVPIGEPAKEGTLTAKRLAEHEIDVTLIPDAAMAIAASRADLVIVGADAITREFFINKVGTSMLAIASRHYGVPFYVCARLVKFIHQENLPRRLRTISASELNPPKSEYITAGAPLFDKTPLSLVTGVITEGGIVSPERGIIEITEVEDD